MTFEPTLLDLPKSADSDGLILNEPSVAGVKGWVALGKTLLEAMELNCAGNQAARHEAELAGHARVCDPGGLNRGAHQPSPVPM